MARLKRQGTLLLKQVLEQLQNDSNSGEESDLEENENYYKNRPNSFWGITVLVMWLS